MQNGENGPAVASAPGRAPQTGTNTVPIMRRLASRNLARVWMHGRWVYLGPWGSEQAQQRYDEEIARFLARGRKPLRARTPLTVGQLIESFGAFVQATRVKRGAATSSASKVRSTLRLAKLGGLANIDTDALKPEDVHAWRCRLAADEDQRWSRETINTHVHVVRRVYQWAAERGMIDPRQVAALSVLRGLRRNARPDPGVPVPREGTKGVRDVDDDRIARTLPHLPPAVAAMVRVQRLTAMRPGEVVALRAQDLHPVRPRPGADPDDRLAAYIVDDEVNKLSHIGRRRVVLIGPTALAIVREWRDHGDTYVFSPRRSLELQGDPNPGRAGECYRVAAYGRSIRRGCDAAGVEGWSPNQLRHSGCSSFADVADLHVANNILGHSSIKTTMTYTHAATPAVCEAVLAHG